MPDQSRPLPLDPKLVKRLYREAGAARWSVDESAFAAALAASAARAFNPSPPSPRELERLLRSLHLGDLALSCACAAGHEGAWDHFIREHRPILYRAADALAPGGAGRELADSLYAELYGLGETAETRRSLFTYFHGRSSLATWLRAVLAQRHVDRIRSTRRLEPLPGKEALAGRVGVASAPDPSRARYLRMLADALRAAIARLEPRDRLRLASYYGQQLRLAQIGRLMGEHEATVSRHLARTRRALRDDVEHQLRAAGLAEDELAACFDSAIEDAGPLDLAEVFGAAGCKPAAPDRSE